MLDPFFERRKQTAGVGYFLTDPQQESGWLARFSIHDLRNNPVKYYVKNVPVELQSAVLAGFDDWNANLEGVLGHELLSYEILQKGDPRYEQIVAGDPRFNVLDWDIENLASYGGLGPAISNTITGQHLAAHVYIQGPTILQIYRAWFKVKDESERLLASNQPQAATQLKRNFVRQMVERSKRENTGRQSRIRLGSLAFRIPALDPHLRDTLAVDPLDFLQIPEGYTYETYMNGYWREIVAHELGHNLGLSR